MNYEFFRSQAPACRNASGTLQSPDLSPLEQLWGYTPRWNVGAMYSKTARWAQDFGMAVYE